MIDGVSIISFNKEDGEAVIDIGEVDGFAVNRLTEMGVPLTSIKRGVVAIDCNKLSEIKGAELPGNRGRIFRSYSA